MTKGTLPVVGCCLTGFNGLNSFMFPPQRGKIKETTPTVQPPANVGGGAM
ncbi:hypothetical protein [Sphingopyxis sp. UBA6734]|nr:hypothetical protein [Sphingopyxis sp. UBA6734]